MGTYPFFPSGPSAPGMRLVYVDNFGADPTGTADSTAAINRAIAALGTSPGNIVFGSGSYLFGASGNLTTLIQNQSITGQGSGTTSFTYQGSTIAINVFLSGVFDGTKYAGKFTGFSMGGPGGTSTGLKYGDLQGLYVDDVAINGFGTGINGKNVAGWSEQAYVRARLIQNTVAAYTYDTNSFDYSNYDLMTVVNANANGIQLQNGAQLAGTHLRIRGNYLSGSSNTGAVIAVAPAGGADTSAFHSSQWDVSVEADPGTGSVGHFTIVNNSTSGASQIYAQGTAWFLNTSQAFQGVSTPHGQPISFHGTFSDQAFGNMQNGDGGVCIGAFDQAVFGNLTTPPFSGDIFCQAADIYAFQLVNGATTISFQSPSNYGRRMDLYIAQPSSGAAGTITWPTGSGGVKWASATPPTLSTVNGRVDHIRLTLLPAQNSWYGELIGTNYA